MKKLKNKQKLKKFLMFLTVAVVMATMMILPASASSGTETGGISTIVDVLGDVGSALFAEDTGAISVFWNWLTSPNVMPVFVIGISVSLLLLAVKICKAVFWGV